jgi:DNA invertase Pin-like site-specific DNA recombinase
LILLQRGRSDRLGRSLQDLLGFLAELKGAAVDLYLDRQAVDTTTPAGKAFFQMLGVFAEFERSIIQERIHAGIARARVVGTKSGKPIGRTKIDATKEVAIRSALASKGILKTAREGGVGSSVVQRIKAGLLTPPARLVENSSDA